MNRSSSRALVLGAVVLVAVGGAVVLASTLFLRGPAPAAVGGTASPRAATSGPAGSGGGSSAGAAPGDLTGTWTLDTSIGSFGDFSSSFVGYRVDETLAGNKANTAVGRTPEVTGALILDGTAITDVQVTADLTVLQSDDDRRDGQLRRQALETDTYPEATFAATQPIDLGGLPQDGGTLGATATGELTLHGVTKTVEIPVQASLQGDVVTVTGSIDIAFADYGIAQPTSFLVLSIEDHGTMEFQLHFRHD